MLFCDVTGEIGQVSVSRDQPEEHHVINHPTTSSSSTNQRGGDDDVTNRVGFFHFPPLFSRQAQNAQTPFFPHFPKADQLKAKFKFVFGSRHFRVWQPNKLDQISNLKLNAQRPLLEDFNLLVSFRHAAASAYVIIGSSDVTKPTQHR